MLREYLTGFTTLDKVFVQVYESSFIDAHRVLLSVLDSRLTQYTTYVVPNISIITIASRPPVTSCSKLSSSSPFFVLTFPVLLVPSALWSLEIALSILT